jgi:BirA family biotin operon repressor/biotin-[acetyl-CoA-carboxylase] ligase
VKIAARGIYDSQVRLTRDGARVAEELPALPSVFTPIIALREGGGALRHACAIAPEKGAGTLVWVRSWARAEAAIVLEPEEALPAARLALHAASVALADALGAYGPPDIPLIFEWPGTLRLNGAVVGQTRLGLPAETPPDGPLPWLVVGMEARFAEYADGEPGETPDRTSLLGEGYDDLTPALLVAAWARHFMATVADWQGRGFKTLAERYLARLDPKLGAGARRGIVPASGDLVLEGASGRETLSLAEALA